MGLVLVLGMSVLTLVCCLSFFEKISTGSNTDSDLRVVRFDAYGRHEEVKAGKQGGDSNNDTVPKFKKPVPSKN